MARRANSKTGNREAETLRPRRKTRRYARQRRGGAAILLATGRALALPAGAPAQDQAQDQTQDWQPVLQPSQSGDYWAPNDPIAIFIPPELPIEVLQNLALELDNFDVTSLIQREGDFALLRLPEPLAPGEHRLRLVEYGQDSSITERGFWTFEVRKNAAFQNVEASANVAFDSTRILTGDNLQGADDNIFQSGGEGRIVVQEGNWSASTQANYLYDSRDEQSLTGREADLGEYLTTLSFQGDDLSSNARLGHHDIGASDFIMSDFYRRGLSLDIGSADSAVQVTGFALSSQALLGIERISGIEDPDDRVQGAHVRLRPIDSLRDNLELTGTYYLGEKTDTFDNDFDIAFDDAFDIEERSDGSGFAVAADSLWFGERLRLRGEFSRSRFDLDGAGGAVDPETDEAYSALANYAILQNELVDELPLNWNLGIQHERLGTFFGSIANPFLIGDRITTTLFSDVTWDTFAFQAQAGHQTNNVNSLDGLPRDRTLNLFLNGSYAIFPGPEEEPLPEWLGLPSLGLSFSIVDIDQTDRPDDFIGEAESQTISSTASFSTSYDTWSWYLSETVSSVNDTVGGDGDTLGFLTSLGSQFLVGNRVSLAPYTQWSLDESQNLNDTVHTWLVGFGAGAEILPSVLSTNLNYSYSHARGAQNTLDTHIFGGELLWTFLRAEQNRPGMAFALSGTIQESHGSAILSTQDRVYQVFLSLKTTLPASY